MRHTHTHIYFAITKTMWEKLLSDVPWTHVWDESLTPYSTVCRSYTNCTCTNVDQITLAYFICTPRIIHNLICIINHKMVWKIACSSRTVAVTEATAAAAALSFECTGLFGLYNSKQITLVHISTKSFFWTSLDRMLHNQKMHQAGPVFGRNVKWQMILFHSMSSH